MKAAVTGSSRPDRDALAVPTSTPANQPRTPATSEEVARYVAQTAWRIAQTAWEEYQKQAAHPPPVEIEELVSAPEHKASPPAR
jgi:hypothetical protein